MRDWKMQEQASIESHGSRTHRVADTKVILIHALGLRVAYIQMTKRRHYFVWNSPYKLK